MEPWLEKCREDAVRKLYWVLVVCVYDVLDGIVVPVMAHCRGERHRCFANQLGIGCGGSDGDCYDRVQLVTAVTSYGVISGWPLGSATTEERWIADALRWRAAPWQQAYQRPWSTTPSTTPPSTRPSGARASGPSLARAR